MERENPETDEQPRRSMSMSYSAGSSVGRHSFRLSGARQHRHHQVEDDADDDDDGEAVSEAGDIGDRELHSWRKSGSFSARWSTASDSAVEKGVGVVFPVSESDDTLLQPNGFWCRDPSASAAVNNNNVSPVSPLPEEIISPLSTNPILDSKHTTKEDPKRILPLWMEYITCLIHLSFFGILGVFTRYLLQKLFGPNVIGATSDSSILYLDLPSNMVGSFLMGWFGVVFKGDIAQFSDYLAIGLSTGYLGSVTTFSGWNQKMLELSLHGQWVLSVLGFLLGLFLAAYSIILGVETAKGFRWFIHDHRILNLGSGSGCRLNNYTRHLVAMLVLSLVTCFLWAISGTLLKHEFNDGGSGPQLWLACIVAPFGVWIRWFLARLNGRGIGKAGLLKWVPFGTLIANVSAACIMAALSTIKKAVKLEACETISTGLQLGLMGCLSTVSTFIAEFNAMRESKHPWRAYAYAFGTIILSFGLGLLIYDLPVRTKGYE